MNFAKHRTLIVLTLSQCFGQTAAPIFVLLGGIIGAQIAPSVDWATLPIAIQIIGLAGATIPASLLMSRSGRKAGFLVGTALGICAALLAAWAISAQSFVLFCVASFLVGNYIAFLQQFRFAVAESVAREQIPKSLSVLMLGGIVAALLGPEVGRRFSDTGEFPLYVGSFLGLAALLGISFVILLTFYRNTDIHSQDHGQAVRPMGQIFRQPTLILAITAAAVGYSVMTLIMTATPLSMHEMDHYSLNDTTWVIQSHILAMYIPSFFSGFLISWLGVTQIIRAGFALMLCCVYVAWGEPAIINYWGALVLLGVAWNFLFLGGTTLLTQSYRSSERFKVQAANDFIVFGSQAVGSLSAGILLASVGWNGVMLFALPILLVLLPVIFMAGKYMASSSAST